jgi:hypothetical protein
MRDKLEIFELTVVVRARLHNPSILNPDFLKYNEVVPIDWELAESPVCTEIVAQVKYKNGVSIVAQPNKVIFAELLAGPSTYEARVPGLAKKYTETLPHVKYDALGINPKGLVVADSEAEAESFLIEKVIMPGPWKTYAGGAKDIKLALQYSVNDAKMMLDAESAETGQQGPYPKGTPIVVFGANFHREISNCEPKQRLERAHEAIDRWRDDLTAFESMVNDCFLKGGQPGA